MKRTIIIALLLAAAQCCFAQKQVSEVSINKMPPLDKFPMDMIYFPANYPVLKVEDKAIEPLMARIIYSRPQKDDRKIFGELVEYGKVWRLGANEATEIELYKDLRINDKKLTKGRYTMYAVPTPTQWTIIFNKDTDTWGAFKYDEKNDVLRVNVPVQHNRNPIDIFTMNFIKSLDGAELYIGWDDVFVTVPVANQ